MTFKKYSIPWDYRNPKHGMNFIESDTALIKDRVKFRCCTQCHLPLNQSEAIRLNDLLGLELPTAESLRDRLARLKAR